MYIGELTGVVERPTGGFPLVAWRRRQSRVMSSRRSGRKNRRRWRGQLWPPTAFSHHFLSLHTPDDYFTIPRKEHPQNSSTNERTKDDPDVRSTDQLLTLLMIDWSSGSSFQTEPSPSKRCATGRAFQPPAHNSSSIQKNYKYIERDSTMYRFSPPSLCDAADGEDLLLSTSIWPTTKHTCVDIYWQFHGRSIVGHFFSLGSLSLYIDIELSTYW